MRKIFLFITLLFCCQNLFAQSKFSKLEGKITDTEGKPLPGATVYIHELNRGTAADMNGDYKIENLRNGSYHLHITFIGYEAVSKTITLGFGDLILNFTLKPSSVELKELIVEAYPFKSGPVEQTMTVDVVERSFFEKNSSNTFAHALQKLPGISTINTGIGIAKPVIRGMSFNRVIINDRGIKQEGQQWGADHGLEIDQFEPERVEIIKGPASLLYGSDAIGGVINIQSPKLPENKTISGSILSLYKSNNELVGTSAMLEGNTNGFVWRGRFSTQDFGDYKVPADSFRYNRFILPVYDNTLKNTAGSERNFTGMVGIKKSWGYSKVTVSNFHQKAGMFPGAFGVPRSLQLQPDGNSRNINLPRQVINHFKVIWNSNIMFGSNWLEADFGYQHNNRREEAAPHAHGVANPDQLGNLALGLVLQTLSGNIRYYTTSDRLKSIYAIQFQYQENKKAGSEHLLPEFTTGNAGAFAYKEYQLNSITTINGGIRFDYGNRNINRTAHLNHYTEEANDSLIRNEEIAVTFYNFSGATGISWYPTSAFNLKLNLGSSFRMPAAAEMASNGIHHGTFRHEVGEASLTTERGIQGDISLSYHRNDLYISISPFASYYQDYIYLAPTAQFSELPEGAQKYQYRQHNSTFMGSEVSADFHLLHELHVGASVEYVYNFNFDTKLPLPFTPPFSILTEADYTLPYKNKLISDINLGLNYQLFAAQNRVDRNEKSTPGYSLAEINTSWQINLQKQAFMFTFAVQNLLNTQYYNHLSRYRQINLPEQGRNFNLQIKIPFSIK